MNDHRPETLSVLGVIIRKANIRCVLFMDSITKRC